MIEVTLLGSGGATPYLQRTTPMIALNVNTDIILFDCGSGATQRLAQAGIKAGSLNSLFFTHFHADHCVDFPIIVLTSYLEGRNAPLKVYGPKGTISFVELMLNDLFSYIPRLISNILEVEFKIDVFEVEPLQTIQFHNYIVKVGAAKHSANSLCYRVDTGIESVAFSGDTEYSQDVINIAHDCNLLIHECPFPENFGATPGHTSPSQVGQIAKKANANSVVIIHLFEEVLGNEDQMRNEIQKNFDGEVIIGEDLMKLRVDGINITKLSN